MHRDNVDKLGLTRYTQRMPRRASDSDEEKNLKLLGVKIPAEMLEEIEQLRVKEKRTKSQVGALLLMRGLAAYNRDGLLLEPEENDGRRHGRR